MTGFDKLKLNKQLIRSVAELGYHVPKEIQQKQTGEWKIQSPN